MTTKKPNTKDKKAIPKPKEAPRADGLPARYGQLVDLLADPKGKTIAEIQEALGKVQAQTVRGMLSIVRKTHGVNIETLRQDEGGALYRVAK